MTGPSAALHRLLGRYGGAATLLVLLAITIASLSPKGSAGDPGSADRLAHVLAYAVAVFPAAAARVRPLWLGAGVLAWGGAIELLQPLVGRSASWADALANGAGVLAGLALGLAARRLLSRAAAPAGRG